MMNTAALLAIARNAALKAGAAIMKIYEQGAAEVNLKADLSPVTAADIAAHHIILELLEPCGLPVISEEGDTCNYSSRQNYEWYWLVDPLDGTKEFIKRNGEFTVNIALIHKHTPVAGVIYAPALHQLYWGSKDTGVYKEEDDVRIELTGLAATHSFEELLQREGLNIVISRSHLSEETLQFINRFNQPKLLSMGSSLKFMLLLENKADLYPKFGPCMEWDTAAAHAILNAAGRSIYQLNLQDELVYNKPDMTNPSFIAF
ncbi:3'(2'),5'-bisphosphate nucleotidase CysQ [Mucilaginibacter sp. RS28]|uniref:3'(2'),5'-bisphosphate nucleotidase CysQ n=1 Tax=Mucilaginibacter straminoryzae TaxID=2932774 RepID=A0A9X1X4W5_9SPHI|nr:3'(2'),5'-bisphosphate nucleotidase CysQ [Mucilaginibacter straminoryzae]MCJ8211046.1 3'(2'),5'-bisphosphate nucleotidase CysQ [Mucilaginibacter straminoryzae]